MKNRELRGHKISNKMFYLPVGVRAFLQTLATPRIGINLFYLLVVMAGPQLAHAEPWDEGADSIYEAIQSVIRVLALIAIAVLGIMAMMGKLAWATAGMIVGGIFITVGGEAIYDYFSDAIG